MSVYQPALPRFYTAKIKKEGGDRVKADSKEEFERYECSIPGMETLCISVRAEKTVYEEAVHWIKGLIYDVDFDDVKLYGFYEYSIYWVLTTLLG